MDSGAESSQPVEEVATPILPRNESPRDIGTVLSTGMTPENIAAAMTALDAGQKNALIFDHAKPPAELPSRYAHGCRRKFNISWLGKFSWLRYSSAVDGVFCGPCAVMMTADQTAGKGALVNSPMNNWAKLRDNLQRHNNLKHHQDSVAAADVLRLTIAKPGVRVDVMANSQLRENQERNVHILKQIFRAIVFLAKQGIPLRGDEETRSMENGTNPGNSLALLKQLRVDDPVLKEHLHTPNLGR